MVTPSPPPGWPGRTNTRFISDADDPVVATHDVEHTLRWLVCAQLVERGGHVLGDRLPQQPQQLEPEDVLDVRVQPSR
jgi:hypothetical protein